MGSSFLWILASVLTKSLLTECLITGLGSYLTYHESRYPFYKGEDQWA